MYAYAYAQVTRTATPTSTSTSATTTLTPAVSFLRPHPAAARARSERLRTSADRSPLNTYGHAYVYEYGTRTRTNPLSCDARSPPLDHRFISRKRRPHPARREDQPHRAKQLTSGTSRCAPAVAKNYEHHAPGLVHRVQQLRPVRAEVATTNPTVKNVSGGSKCRYRRPSVSPIPEREQHQEQLPRHEPRIRRKLKADRWSRA